MELNNGLQRGLEGDTSPYYLPKWVPPPPPGSAQDWFVAKVQLDWVLKELHQGYQWEEDNSLRFEDGIRLVEAFLLLIAQTNLDGNTSFQKKETQNPCLVL